MRQQLKVKHTQVSLGKQIKEFLIALSLFLPSLKEVDLKPSEPEDELINAPVEEFVELEDLMDGSLEEDGFNEEEDEAEAQLVLPESVTLPLPSNITLVKLRPAPESLILVERA